MNVDGGKCCWFVTLGLFHDNKRFRDVDGDAGEYLRMGGETVFQGEGITQIQLRFAAEKIRIPLA